MSKFSDEIYFYDRRELQKVRKESIAYFYSYRDYPVWDESVYQQPAEEPVEDGYCYEEEAVYNPASNAGTPEDAVSSYIEEPVEQSRPEPRGKGVKRSKKQKPAAESKRQQKRTDSQPSGGGLRLPAMPHSTAMEEYLKAVRETGKTHKPTNRRERISNILLIVFVCIFVFSSVELCFTIRSYRKAAEDFNVLSTYVVQDENLIQGNTAIVKSKTVDEDGNVSESFETIEVGEDEELLEDVFDENGILLKYSSLYSMNNDIVGWIYSEGTVINYPIMYSPYDPEYYLHRNYKKEYSAAGTPFMGDGCTLDSNNILLHGHHMRDGSMFASISGYSSWDYYQKHKYIHFDTIYGSGTYEVIAAFATKIFNVGDEAFRYYQYGGDLSQETFNTYVRNITSLTPYKMDSTAVYGDKLISLSTCSYHVENGRYVIVAKRVGDGFYERRIELGLSNEEE